MCNAACQAKIILNGHRVANEIKANEKLKEHLDKNRIDISNVISEEQGQKIIGALDVIEDLLMQYNELLVAATGHKRKVPKASL